MDCKIFTRIGTEKPQVIPSCALSDPFVPAQFCIVRKYEDLYAEALPRFTKSKRTPYALPAANKAMHTYCGIDRDPLKYTPDDFHMYSYRDALTHFNTLSKPDAELIFIRAVGCDAPIPEGMFLLGYDAAWTFGLGICDGFSAICDCMFLCRSRRKISSALPESGVVRRRRILHLRNLPLMHRNTERNISSCSSPSLEKAAPASPLWQTG